MLHNLGFKSRVPVCIHTLAAAVFLFFFALFSSGNRPFSYFQQMVKEFSVDNDILFGSGHSIILDLQYW